MKPQNLFPNLKAWKEVRLTDHLDLFDKNKPCDWQNELENIYDANIYGGFLEDRSPLFDERHDKNSPIHVGVDFWVEENTPIFFDFFNSKPIYWGNSDNCRGGWGYRLDVKVENKVYIFGHLSGTDQKGNDMSKPYKYWTECLSKATGYNFIGRIGSREENGGWRPHLHLQVVDYEFYSLFSNPRNIDAYMPNDPEILQWFYNPISEYEF